MGGFIEYHTGALKFHVNIFTDYISGVFGGLDMHGIQRATTWTQLGRTAFMGKDTLELATPVDWPVGSFIVFEVIGISQDNTTLILNGILEYDHFGKC